jgi:hypothetical protein
MMNRPHNRATNLRAAAEARDPARLARKLGAIA